MVANNVLPLEAWPELPGYELQELVFQDAVDLLFRARHLKSGEFVLVRTSRANRPDQATLELIQRSWNGAGQLAHPVILTHRDKVEMGNRIFLVLDHLDGVQLPVFRQELKSREALWPLAVQAGELLMGLEGLELVLRDFRPSRWLVGKDGSLRLWDAAGVTQLSGRTAPEAAALPAPEVLAYWAPERTGRIRWSEGPWSDQYALGIWLYELFTGELPFFSSDPLELIHQHSAVMPPDLTSQFAQWPPLALLVNRLLAKSPPERYQTANGLLQDLLFLAENHREATIMAHYNIGGFDVPSRIRIPDKLFGREEELGNLQDLLEGLTKTGSKMVAVEGQMGYGKSKLVEAFRNVLRSNNSIYAGGAYFPEVQDFRETGVAALVRALVRRIFRWDDEKIAEWKGELGEKIRDSLGSLSGMIPELKALFPRAQSELIPNVKEEQNRITYLFVALLDHLLPKDVPVTLFQDDLQWADPLSISLLQQFMASFPERPWLLVAAVPDFNQIPEELRTDFEWERMTLGPLPPREVERYLDTTLGSNGKNPELAELVHRRTHGVPSFLNQFMRLVAPYFSYDFEQQAWTYDTQAIAGVAVPEGVAELIRSRAEALPSNIQGVLTRAAVFGMEIDEELLVYISEDDAGAVAKLLGAARDSGILSRIGKGHWSFQHQILQAHFRDQLTPAQVTHFNTLIAIRLWERHRKTPVDFACTIELFRHLARSDWQSFSREKLGALMELGRKTGIEAFQSQSFRQAELCLATAWQLEERAMPQEDPLEIPLLLAHTHRFLGEMEKAEKVYEELLGRNLNVTGNLRVSTQLVLMYTTEGRHVEALEVGRNAIRNSKLMKPLPRRKGAIRLEMIRSILGLRRKFKGASAKVIDALPTSELPELSPMMMLMRRMNNPALSVDSNLFALLVTREVKLTMKYGLNPHAGPGLMGLAVMTLVGFKDYENALKLAHSALEVHDLKIRQEGMAEVRFGYSHFFLHLEKPLRKELPRYLDSYQDFIARGTNLYAGYSINSRLWSMGTLGLNLSEIGTECRQYMDEFKRRREWELYDMMKPKWLFVEAMQGRTQAAWTLETPDYAPRQKAVELKERGSLSILAGLLLAELELTWYGQRFREGLAIARQMVPVLPNMEGIYFSSDFHLFASLHLLQRFLSDGQRPDRRARKALKDRLNRFEALYKLQPDNYATFYLLLRGAVECMVGEMGKGIQWLEKAADKSQEQQNSRSYAIASELVYRLSVRQGQPKEEALKNARQGYLIWGATAKVRALDAEMGSGQGSGTTNGGMAGSDALDLASILKASNVLAGELRLNELMRTLVNVLLENAGAQRGVLLLREGDEWVLAMEGEAGKDPADFREGGQGEATTDVPWSVVQFVERSGETLVLEANDYQDFGGDPYLLQQQPQALLCHPIMTQGRLIGLAYLENRLVQNAFTSTRVQTLRLLSGQIGISIENARFYGQLEEKVRERTRQIENQRVEIQLEKQKSDDLLLNILPEAVAHELKETGRTKARRYEEVSILFSDIVGFTGFAEAQTPEALVRSLDRYFGRCDKVVDELGLEKIKTIGDAYMCVGGLAEDDPDAARRVVLAAQRMLDVVDELQQEGLNIQIRIGIHTGPVVAGVVGSRKFAYDIWGDSVNTAARMEAASESMRINISQNTFDRVGDHFTTDFRGKIKVKNKGELPMYFVRREGNDKG